MATSHAKRFRSTLYCFIVFCLCLIFISFQQLTATESLFTTLITRPGHIDIQQSGTVSAVPSPSITSVGTQDSLMVPTPSTNENCTDIQFLPSAQESFERVWTKYRLADIIFNYTGIGTEETVCGLWPTSMGCQFLLSKTPSRNVSWLIPYYEAHKNQLGADMSQYTVLHLRLGDVIRRDGCWEMGCPFFHSAHAAHNYVYPKRYYEAILPSIPKTKPIMIVGNPYHGKREGQVEKNLQYLRKVVCFFRSHGFMVIYFGDNKTPDEDFLAMISTSTFIQGGGGYSRIAASILKLKHKEVIFKNNDITKRNIMQ